MSSTFRSSYLFLTITGDERKKKKIKGKFKEKGIKMLLVGYSANHPRGTYRMYNPAKQTVIDSQHIYWHDFTPFNPKSDMSVFVKYPTLKRLQ